MFQPYNIWASKLPASSYFKLEPFLPTDNTFYGAALYYEVFPGEEALWVILPVTLGRLDWVMPNLLLSQDLICRVRQHRLYHFRSWTAWWDRWNCLHLVDTARPLRLEGINYLTCSAEAICLNSMRVTNPGGSICLRPMRKEGLP